MSKNDPVPETLASRAKRLWHLWVVIGVVVLLLGGYAAGFRPGPGLTIVRVGMLTITDIPAGTAAFADQASRGVSTGTSLTMNLVPGNHTIIVSAPNDEPWEKVVAITSNETTTVSPILVPMKPTPTLLGGADAVNAASAILKTIVPTPDAPIVVGCANIYVFDNRVVAAPATSTPDCATPPEYLCTNGSCAPTIVYTPPTPIREVIAFPNRTDAVLVATGASVNAVGLDPRYPQYFAPVVKGTSPTIGAASTTGFYLTDLGKAYFIGL